MSRDAVIRFSTAEYPNSWRAGQKAVVMVVIACYSPDVRMAGCVCRLDELHLRPPQGSRVLVTKAACTGRDVRICPL